MSWSKVSNTKGDNSLDIITQLTNDFNQLNFIDCQKLADMNEPDGIFWLGYCYEYGIGVEKDVNKAFINYRKSAEMNNPNGMYQVGYCYYLGIGVEIDKHKAFMYYLRSAEAGNSMGIWKTAVCYYYGIGVESNEDKFEYWRDKDSHPLRFTGTLLDRYPFDGKCAHCNEYNTWKAWCQACDPDIIIQGWTSRNKKIDDFIKGFQLRISEYEIMIEWIPFDRLNNIKKIGQGGFSSVFSATWSDGIRKLDDKNVRIREPFSTVALKTLAYSKENSPDFLKEFESHIKCNKIWSSKLEIYGLTQNAKANEYLMVFQYANNGSLYKFLRTDFQDLTWQTKLKLLKDISYDLMQVHNAGYIHSDFHSGNILQDKGMNKIIQSYISDLGLSKEKDKNDSGSCIYGVMPYVAPEVLSGQKFTPAADIYGFGVIMSEMSTGQRPFDGCQFNDELAVKICFGLRPEFATGTPDFYIELAKQCMDSDPQKRPTAIDVTNELEKWNESMYSSDDADEIKKQFLNADKIVKELPTISPKHPEFMYTSKIINTQRISAIQATLRSKPIDSVEVPLDD